MCPRPGAKFAKKKKKKAHVQLPGNGHLMKDMQIAHVKSNRNVSRGAAIRRQEAKMTTGELCDISH